jgi:O-acetyl-ADP-ribose deacetylase (regulator of RNase III)
MTIEIMPVGADIFASGADSLVNPVDCTGAQGKGLAKAFVRYAPDACAWFKRVCPIQIGDVVPCLTVAPRERGERKTAAIIYFFPTKRHWRLPSRLEDIAAGFQLLTARDSPWRPPASVAIPALGCGLGELAWDDVRPLILDAAKRMSEVGVRVLVYPPHEVRG